MYTHIEFENQSQINEHAVKVIDCLTNGNIIIGTESTIKCLPAQLTKERIIITIGEKNDNNLCFHNMSSCDAYLKKNNNTKIKRYIITIGTHEVTLLDVKHVISAKYNHKMHYNIAENSEEMNLHRCLKHIISNGNSNPNRTDIDTLSVFGKMFEYKMEEQVDTDGTHMYKLPLITSKRMFTRGVFEELKWFLKGGTNSRDLSAIGINIWNGNTSRQYLDKIGLTHYKEDECGPIYGFQWRHWGANYESGKTDYGTEGIDQIANVINSLKTDPFGRRHIINGWNVTQLKEMCLPPCHVMYQFYVHEENGNKYLSLMMTQRSCDAFLGLPFNICSVAMLLFLMSHHVGMKPYKIVHSIGDMHIYKNHIKAVEQLVSRTPYQFPFIKFRKPNTHKTDLSEYNFDDIEIVKYYCHDLIKAQMVA